MYPPYNEEEVANETYEEEEAPFQYKKEGNNQFHKNQYKHYTFILLSTTSYKKNNKRCIKL